MLKLWKSSLNLIELRPQWKIWNTQQMQGNLHKSPFAYNTSFRFGRGFFLGKMTTHWFRVWHFSFIRWFFAIICSFFTPCTGFPHDGYNVGVRWLRRWRWQQWLWRWQAVICKHDLLAEKERHCNLAWTPWWRIRLCSSFMTAFWFRIYGNIMWSPRLSHVVFTLETWDFKRKTSGIQV